MQLRFVSFYYTLYSAQRVIKKHNINTIAVKTIDPVISLNFCLSSSICALLFSLMLKYKLTAHAPSGAATAKMIIDMAVNGGVKFGHCGGAKVGQFGASALERAALI